MMRAVNFGLLLLASFDVLRATVPGVSVEAESGADGEAVCLAYPNLSLRLSSSKDAPKSKVTTVLVGSLDESPYEMGCACSILCKAMNDDYGFWSVKPGNAENTVACICLKGRLRGVSVESKKGRASYSGGVTAAADAMIHRMDMEASLVAVPNPDDESVGPVEPCMDYPNRNECRADPGCSWRKGNCKPAEGAPTEQVDIAVVGAGTSGLYMALRLKEAYPEKSIKVYEMLDRVGGRFWSPLFVEPWASEDEDAADFDIQQFHWEMGGMRYTKEHWRLNTLFNKLGMCDQRVNFAFGHSGEESHLPWFFRGTSGDWHWRNITKTYEELTVNGLFNVEQDEMARSPDELLVRMKAMVNELNNLDQKAPMDRATDGQYFPQRWLDWFNKVEVAGKSLYDWNFYALLLNLGLSDEALMYTMDMYGFTTTFVEDVSGAWGMLSNLGDFGNSDAAPFHTVCGGVQQLPLKLAKTLQGLDGDFLRLGYKLNEIDALYPDDDAKFMLRFDDMGIKDTGSSVSVEVRESVILAFPPNMVERLIPETPWEKNKEVEKLFSSVIDEKLHKVNLMFDQKFWLDKNEEYWVEEGGAYTSLPAGTLYIEKIWENDNMGVVTLYFDGDSAHFWDSLQDMAEPCDVEVTDEDIWHSHAFGPGESPCGYYGFHFGYEIENWAEVPNRASRAIVNYAMNSIAQVFKREIEKFPMPVAAFYSPWGTDLNFGASCFQYKRTANITDVVDRIHQPDPNFDIFYASSGVSVLNEWVEGGLAAADNVLTKGFGLDVMSSADDCPFTDERCRCAEPDEHGGSDAQVVLEQCRDEDYAKWLHMYHEMTDAKKRNPIFADQKKFEEDIAAGRIRPMDSSKGHMFN